jgi:DNA-binding SARP family transcriptional activator
VGRAAAGVVAEGGAAIETSPLGYRLAIALGQIDAQRFERAVGRARELLAAEDAERAALVLADGLALWSSWRAGTRLGSRRRG